MTIIPRGKKFGVKVYDPEAKGQQRWVGTFNTRKEAKAAEVRAERDVENGLKAPQEMTYGEYAKRWLTVHCAHLEGSTMIVYRSCIDRFVRDHGHRKIGSLDRPTIIDWCGGVPLNCRRVARTMFGRMHDEGLIDSNPFDRVRIQGKRGGRGGKNLVVVSEHELAQLVHSAEACWDGPFGESFGAMIRFAAYTGMRPGEMFALRWEDLDIENYTVHVRASRSITGDLKTPKNGLSRIITLPPAAIRDLSKIMRVDGQPWVFLSRSGIQYSKTSFLSAWRPVRVASRAPIKDFYELRHHCATYLLDRGVSPWDVAIQLGHQDGGTEVIKTYGHPDEGKVRQRILRAFEDAA